MKEKPIISAKQAAEMIGCDPQKVREHLKRGIWTFGIYVPKSKTGKAKNEYLINRAALERYLKGETNS